MTLQQRLALTIKIFSCRSRNPCWKVLPQGNPIIWEGSTPEGWFFLKNSWEDVPEKWKWKVKVRCLQIICLFLSRIWFFYQLVGKCDQGNTPKHVICQISIKFRKYSSFEKVREKKSTTLLSKKLGKSNFSEVSLFTIQSAGNKTLILYHPKNIPKTCSFEMGLPKISIFET